MAHFVLARIQTLRGEYDTAIEELRTALDLNPNLALAHFGLGFALMLSGRQDEAIPKFDTAIRLSPRDPLCWAFFLMRSWTQLLLGNYDAAVHDARRANQYPAASFMPRGIEASALALLDRRGDAKNVLDELLKINPHYSPNAALAALSPLTPEALRPKFKTWIDGLRKAGLDIPDEPTAAD
jgi:tetratricopeptide (TPR) repeat protein